MKLGGYVKFKVMMNEDSETQLYSFKIPQKNEKLRVLNGGDIGTSKWSLEMLKMLNKRKKRNGPYDLIFLGGDIAYCNNFAGCNYLWDDVLDFIPY